MLLTSIIAAYRGLPRAVWWLAVASAVNRSGTMVLPFFALYLTNSRGLGPDQAGRLIALYGVAALFGSYLGGALTDRFTTKRVQSASLLLTAGMLLVLSEQRDPACIALAVFGFGVTNEALRPANLAAFAAASGEATKTRALALARLSVNLGESCGLLLGGELSKHSFQAIFIVDAVTCVFAAWIISVTQRHSAPRPLSARPPLFSFAPLRDKPFAIAVVLIVLLASVLFQITSTCPLFLSSHYRFENDVIGRVMAVNTILIVICEMVLVKRLEHRAPLPLVAIGSLLLCCGLGILPLFHDVAGAVFSMIVLTVGEMFWAPFLSSFVVARAGDSQRGQYMGLYVLAFAAGQTLGPWCGTLLYDRVAPSTPFYASLAVGPFLALGFLALHNQTARASTPKIDSLA